MVHSIEIQSCNSFPSVFLLLFAATHWSSQLLSIKVKVFFICLWFINLRKIFVTSSAVPDSQETKHQKATAIASRLLKEIAGEQVASPHQDSSSNNGESKDTIIPVNRPPVEKVESHIEKANDDSVDDDDEDVDFTPTLDDLYEIYGNKYAQLVDDEEASSEDVADDEYFLPISTQQLMRYLAEQEESKWFQLIQEKKIYSWIFLGDEQLTPVVHTPVMDDSIMTAEDHRRRRRSIY